MRILRSAPIWFYLEIIIYLFTMLFLAYTIYSIFNQPVITEFESYNHISQPKVSPITKAKIAGLIAQKSVEAGLDPIVSLKVAFKESSYDDQARNPSSTAKGVFQFIDGTWKNYCEGEVLNAEHNIDCFLKNYPKHKSWWK